MSDHTTPRCRSCSNCEPVSGACSHANRQALVSYFTAATDPTCPEYTPRGEDS